MSNAQYTNVNIVKRFKQTSDDEHNTKHDSSWFISAEKELMILLNRYLILIEMYELITWLTNYLNDDDLKTTPYSPLFHILDYYYFLISRQHNKKYNSERHLVCVHWWMCV